MHIVLSAKPHSFGTSFFTQKLFSYHYNNALYTETEANDLSGPTNQPQHSTLFPIPYAFLILTFRS